MTKLNVSESALFLMSFALSELTGHDLRTQLARLLLEKAIEAARGNVNLEQYAKKILGVTTNDEEPQR
jgi:hypothetical protein